MMENIDGTVCTMKDLLLKRFLRVIWRFIQTFHVIVSSITAGRRGPIKIFYGGARSGNLGGPLVKVKRLQEFFPQHLFGYNIVYTLSNTPYLPPLALDLLRWRGIPIVLNQNGVFYSAWYAGDYQRQNILMAEAYHRADYVFWQSEFCRRSADKFLGCRKGEGEVLFNAVDIERFRPVLKSGRKTFTFLLTGKINRHLNYRLASTVAGLAVARSRGLDARLRIAGWIEEIEKLRTLVSQYGLNGFVDLVGEYTQEQAPSIYQSADAYVMTKYLDPCPNTVIEAMACGLPILYSESGGVPELVGPHAGVPLSVPERWDVIHSPTETAVAAGMLEIASCHEQMGTAARERALNHFDLRIWIERHRIIFNQLLGRK